MRTQRVAAMPFARLGPPPGVRSSSTSIAPEKVSHAGQEVAAAVFVSGVFGLLVVLWWLV
jgi:hypothetical protein